MTDFCVEKTHTERRTENEKFRQKSYEKKGNEMANVTLLSARKLQQSLFRVCLKANSPSVFAVIIAII